MPRSMLFRHIYALCFLIIMSRYIPIIASVSEHQPTAWGAFFNDLHFLIFAFPAGVALCFRELRDEHVFVIIYGVVASYFAGVMVRLMLTLTPVVCVAGAVAISTLLDVYIDPQEPDIPEEEEKSTGADTSKKEKKRVASNPPVRGISSLFTPSNGKAAPKASPKYGIFGLDTRIIVISNVLFMMLFFVQHCTWVTSTSYSSPSVVLSSRNSDGSNHIIDDYREAYYWLRQNTPQDAVVMSWWDYGYQIAGMADRSTLVDNNTWNNSMCTCILIIS